MTLRRQSNRFHRSPKIWAQRPARNVAPKPAPSTHLKPEKPSLLILWMNASNDGLVMGQVALFGGFGVVSHFIAFYKNQGLKFRSHQSKPQLSPSFIIPQIERHPLPGRLPADTTKAPKRFCKSTPIPAGTPQSPRHPTVFPDSKANNNKKIYVYIHRSSGGIPNSTLCSFLCSGPTAARELKQTTDPSHQS